MNNFNEQMLKKQYYGQTFTWAVPITSEQIGDPTRCTGVRFSESTGTMCLDLSNGAPVPIDRINFYLKAIDGGAIPEPPRLDENANFEVTRNNNIQQPQQNFQQHNIPQPPVQTVQSQVESTITSLFGNFTTKKEKLKIEVEVEIPDYDLVNMMYKNSAKKDEFLLKFAEYIKSSITVDCVTKAIQSEFEIEDPNATSL